MPDIYELINQFRTELLRNERQAAAAMVREYGKIWQTIDTRIKSLAAQYYASEQPQLGWLYETERLQSLRSQVEQEIARFSKIAGETILEQNSQAVKLAAQHTERMIGTYAGFNKLPREALANIIGALQPGTALSGYLAGLGSGMGQMVSDKLVEGLAMGLGAMEISRMIREAFGANLTSALRTARTEPLRAYREASRQVYQANSHIVGGWIWRSARNERTCGMCWAMDGTEHGLDEQLDDHICGRCFMTPMLSGMERKETGPEAFGKLPASQQLKILGPAKYAAWKDGKFSLPDLVGRKYDPRWGWMRYEKSLASILGTEEAKNYYSVLTVTKDDAKRLLELANRLQPEIEKRLELKSFWSGELNIEKLRGGAYGIKHWSCTIGIDRTAIQAGEAVERSVLLHELLHSYSVGGNEKAAFLLNRGWEEGVVEATQRLLHTEVYGALNIQSAAVGGAYEYYLMALESIRIALQISQVDFYYTLMRTNLADRQAYVMKLAAGNSFVESIINTGILNQ